MRNVVLSDLVFVNSPLTNSFGGLGCRCKSLIRISKASTALIPFPARSKTYVFSLISEHVLSIFTISSLDSASLFLLTTFGSFIFNLNIRGLMSTS